MTTNNHPHGGQPPGDLKDRGDGGMNDPESGGGDQTKGAVESKHPDGKPHENPPDKVNEDGKSPDGEQ